MSVNSNYPVKELRSFTGPKNLIIFIGVLLLICFLPFFGLQKEIANAELAVFCTEETIEKLNSVQNNSLLAISNPNEPKPKPVEIIKMVITAYSSSTYETDETPFITAANTVVREGVVANNFLPFGTKIRIPELYGEKIFVVEDRMHWRKGCYHLDIWFPEQEEAVKFGAKQLNVEILEG